MDRDRRMQMENIQAQSQSNAQAAQQAAQIELQKNQVITQSQIQLEQAKAGFEAQKLQQEMEAKKQLMEIEFNYNMQLRSVESSNLRKRESMKEDRKDERTKIQASQQSEMIDQRKNNKPAKKFESAGNDTMGEGFGLEAFGPK
jgi:multidrug efflux pump subunit AcrA (membrane-fusion protein)